MSNKNESKKAVENDDVVLNNVPSDSLTTGGEAIHLSAKSLSLAGLPIAESGFSFKNITDLLQGLSNEHPANKDYAMLLSISNTLYKVLRGEEALADNPTIIEQALSFLSTDGELGNTLRDVVDNLSSDDPAKKEYQMLLSGLSLLTGIIHRGDNGPTSNEDKSILEIVWDFIKELF